ncbi:uncharacterized protein LOC110817444 [Carica papaya]|uniref:uncharacterized protein LOC110817444 n=1 Tax=Carica papaya TaxID=3649 RepID=UPI000B8C71F2|nr:uncharacterized protein LOC110817444 [Carica papaya]
MTKDKIGNDKLPGNIWRPIEASVQIPSNISCIKCPGKHTRPTDDCSGIRNALITTLGSGSSGGSVFLFNLEALDFNSVISMRRRLHRTASLNCTVWTADYNFNASQAVIGTNLGAALVNLETGTASWVLRSKSDILSQQFDQSGNVVLCGLRNGAILTIDTRVRQERLPSRFIKHRIPVQGSSKKWFELKGNINPSDIIFMPSSISCLVSLQLYDQYFLASSMDGSVSNAYSFKFFWIFFS